MRSSSLVTLAFVIFTAPALGSTPLCGLTIATLREKAPQILQVSGTHDDHVMVLRGWPIKDETITDGSNDPHKVGSVHIGEFYANHVVHYGRTVRGLPATDDDADGLRAALVWLFQELVNNASYHGSAGSRDERFRIALRFDGNDAHFRISDQGRYFDIQPFTIEMTEDEMYAAYTMGDNGNGGIGIRCSLPQYMNRYGFGVRSVPRDDGDGVPRTDVLIHIPLERSLRTQR